MASINKKIKLFNKVLNEFLKEYNTINSEQLSLKVKEYKILAMYKSDIEKVNEQFISCDPKCLKDISLCSRFNLDSITPEIYNNNKKIIWKYLHDLYFITLEKDKLTDDLLLDSRRSINNLVTSITSVNPITSINSLPDLTKMFGDSNDGMQSMINDITREVTDKLKNQDLSNIDPMTLMTQLMSGNNSINGIDLSSIIQSSVSKMQVKIENGEIDLENLQNIVKPFVPDGFEEKINKI